MWSPALWSAIISVFLAVAVPIAKKVLIALGVGALVYPAADFLLDEAKGLILEYIDQYVTLATAQLAIEGVMGILGKLQIDKALNLIFSGLAVRITFLMLNRVQSKPIWNPPGTGGVIGGA